MITYPTSFNDAINFVFKSEGGTNPDPLDRGGLTKFGISSKQYPNLDIINLTIEHATAIYYRDYWSANNCGKFSKAVGSILLDSSVNCGSGSAAKWLQKTISGKGQKLKIDGIIGPKTIEASTQLPEHVLISGLISYRLKRYTTLVRKYPTQRKFILGWVDRVSNLLLSL